MGQQLGIVTIVDIGAAIKDRKLDGNIYLMDNMRTKGSEGQGTGQLISAVNGTYWFDGSQAGEQVINWLTYSIDAAPPTLPKGFFMDHSKTGDIKGLEGIIDSLKKIVKDKDNVNVVDKIVSSTEELEKIIRKTETTGGCNIMDLMGNVWNVGYKIMDITGKLIGEDQADDVYPLPPIITDITGEAVDKGVIFEAQYGSPDLVRDGWYWSATVDTNKTGTFDYTMHFALYHAVTQNGKTTWIPEKMTYDSQIRITSRPKKNGFTNGTEGYIPVR